MVISELQAIVLAAGRGTRMTDLVGDNPKCLLPVGPFPLLFYPLQLLQQHGFQEAIVVVLETQKLEIQQTLDKTPLKMKIDYATIQADTDLGTADSLRYIYDKIKSDFLMISCDVVTNVSLFPLINKFRQHNASLCALMFSKDLGGDVTAPGPKAKYKPERDLIGLDPDTNRLVFVGSITDFEEEVLVSGHLMRTNGKIDMYSRLVDSHIYIMRKWILDFLTKKDNISTLKGEFLPYIVKKQMSKDSQPAMDHASEFAVKIKQENDIFFFVPHCSQDQQVINASLYSDSRFGDSYNGGVIRCYAVEIGKESFGYRLNTTAAYFAMNQKLPSMWAEIFGATAYPLISPNAVVNSTQTKDIAVADNAKLSEKTSLTGSTFGPYCTIHEKTVILNSVVMAHAVIEEGSRIENSIICNKAVVKRGSILKNCLVGPNFIVEENSKIHLAILTNADQFMEIE